MAWMFRALGPGYQTYLYTGLVIWGICILYAFNRGRKQGLDHSVAGVMRKEIDAKTEVAIHAIDTHADLIRERWDREDERTARDENQTTRS